MRHLRSIADRWDQIEAIMPLSPMTRVPTP